MLKYQLLSRSIFFKKIFFVAAALCFSHLGVASQLPEYPFIHTTGVAYIRLTPDIGEINFDIKVSHPDSEKALELAMERISEIKILVSAQSVAEDDILLRDLKKEIKQNATDSGTTEPSVHLSYNVSLKIRDLKNWQPVMSAILKLGNVDKLETFFDSTLRDKIELDLSIEAAKDAQKKASALVSAYGKRLGSVTAMSEGKLKNLSAAVGLVSERIASYDEVEHRQAIGEDLFVIPPLKLQSSVDAIFRIK